MPPVIVARIRESEPVRGQANKFGPGVSPSWDQDNHVVKIEFDPERFNHDMAKNWLLEHDYAEFTIINRERYLGLPFTSLGGKYEHTPEGGLRVRGVKLLAAGTWTDSAQKTPCEYSPDVLSRFATNWQDNAIWSRHYGGVPRSITEKVGLVENQRYENDAVVGDLHYHGLTQQSRDTIAMIDGGLANFVSVETISKDKWNVGKKAYQAQELGFTGLATVNQGACKVCKIRDNEQAEQPEKIEAQMPEQTREDEITDTKGSLETLRDTLREALNTKFGTKDPAGFMSYPYIVATLPDQLIYEGDIGGGKQYRIPYQIDGDQVTFGEPVEVSVAYQDVNEEPPRIGAFEMDEKELEAKLIGIKQELVDVYTVKISELSAELATAQGTIKELSQELDKLKKTPAPKSMMGAGGETKELEMSPYTVNYDKTKGTIRRVG